MVRGWTCQTAALLFGLPQTAFENKFIPGAHTRARRTVTGGGSCSVLVSHLTSHMLSASGFIPSLSHLIHTHTSHLSLISSHPLSNLWNVMEWNGDGWKVGWGKAREKKAFRGICFERRKRGNEKL